MRHIIPALLASASVASADEAERIEARIGRRF